MKTFSTSCADTKQCSGSGFQSLFQRRLLSSEASLYEQGIPEFLVVSIHTPHRRHIGSGTTPSTETPTRAITKGMVLER